ncbi:hypothetical protein Rpal_3359 [Rhodopseudomonas palustris TIE-1]|uniref:hypothetical protein n=1 Tax=Rhodopseudomonas palustris TaxID=1076 RepID=UPI0001779758|nr:hypothetical protein [Rhodopseudomonas palustris]ACF01861.1 hypothetical protein Rpal_3359 [Rhodopseudomonas palustris TIE-1]
MRRTKFVIAFVVAMTASTASSAFSVFQSSTSGKMIAACEASLKRRLLDPSSYRRIEAAAEVNEISLDEYFKRSNHAPATQELMRRVGNKASRVTAILDYNARTAAGLTTRNVVKCTYETTGEIGEISEHAVEIDGKSFTSWLVDRASRSSR